MVAINQTPIMQCGMNWQSISARGESRRTRTGLMPNPSTSSTAKFRNPSTADQVRFTALTGLESKTVRKSPTPAALSRNRSGRTGGRASGTPSGCWGGELRSRGGPYMSVR
jgi:hypothetical protein